MGHALYPSWWPSLTEDEQIEHIQRLQTEREFVQWLALRTRHCYASSLKPTQPIQSSSNEEEEDLQGIYAKQFNTNTIVLC